MYYNQPNMWGHPYQPKREEMMMPADKQQQMMEMMKEHMQMTEEIRQMVNEINERLQWMESKMR
ncbi:DUF342 domain-containing protein [Lentibacillus cibarius]|uniref:DUF342 domain-containing protein n=1 Tax=Lentibacillus cibarius TaxID=2583219 RepID=A0A5S3QN08_9BACI|nr:DUF342 domain-containing protein [Lentibacillus cibarius]TMN23342.1 DUF342 domain-containing protein [Lentibacillus cibarius]